MAAAQHSPPRAPLPAAPATRRDVLAAALAVPLVLDRHPGLGSHPSTTLMGTRDPRPRNTAATPVRSEVFLGPGFRRDDEEALSFVVTKWDRALARYRAAEAALAAVAGTEDEDVYDRHLLRFNAALKKLLRTPAPACPEPRRGAAALAFKLELTIEHLAWELTGGERCMAALLQDARRLAASPAS